MVWHCIIFINNCSRNNFLNGNIAGNNLKNCRSSNEERLFLKPISRVFQRHQLWTVNYYIKSLSNNLSNENINTGSSREVMF